jgi:hypothetical protein
MYIGSAVAALYLNVFVGVTQAFQKLSFLQPLAPTQSEPPFLVAQLAVLTVFVALGVLATIRFHPDTKTGTQARSQESAFGQPRADISNFRQPAAGES